MQITISTALDEMAHAMCQSQQAFHSFLTLAQNHDFENAARCQVNASGLLERAMDAFMDACRQQAIAMGYDDLSDSDA